MTPAGLPLSELVHKLCDGPDSTSSITLHQLFVLITITSQLKNDIILTQPAYLPASTPPAVLPPVIIGFIADCCQCTVDCVEHMWDILKETVWYNANDYRQGPRSRTFSAFAEYGHDHGLSTFSTVSDMRNN